MARSTECPAAWTLRLTHAAAVPPAAAAGRAGATGVATAARPTTVLLAAALDRGNVQLRRGRHAEPTPVLTDHAERHPLDERIAAQLMLTLYRCGRPADALHHYQELRHRLAEELGIDLGPALREMYRQILVSDPRLAPPDRPLQAPGAPGQSRALPLLFIGRDWERARLTSC
ncbi:AfsR/SARP family transcriptional regulator [Streptomyces lydicus]|uniref:AfsR/SARP family transcriptional regulator n=1 Tax=Streptomyces lydicus TaxID=47763 RepID=UPI0036E02061